MSKIIVVGHRSIDLNPLNKLLQKVGVEQASYKDKSPIEIDAIIKKVLKGSNNQAPTIWNGLALNLLLENIDKPLWGWSNSDALYVLDYWKSISPDFKFILSYDDPVNALMRLSIEDDIEQNLDDWLKYHQKLLKHYSNDQGRSLLLNQTEFNKNSNYILPLLKSNILELDLQMGMSYEGEQKETLLLDKRNFPEITIRDDFKDEELLQRYILSDVITQYPEVIELYQKLQAVADLPLENSNNSGFSPIEAWRLFGEIQKTQFSKKEELFQKITTLEEEGRSKEQELRNENHLLLEQLHLTQEEMEKFYLKTNVLEQKIDEKDDALKLYQQEVKHIQALQIEKEEIIKLQQQEKEVINLLESEKKRLIKERDELKEALDKTQIKSEQDNFELLQQLHIVQEELEAVYLRQKREEEDRKRGPYGAADRIKQQLGYRIGATLIENGKSFTGIISLPFKLVATYRLFKKDRKKQPKLPPVHTYQDYYDVDRVKGHLSYRLGNYFINNIAKPWKWIVMPWQMNKIVKQFRLEKKDK